MNSEESVSEEKSDAPRERFGSRLEGILYCAGMAVGLGDVWRFPFLVYQNGGGAFVVAYLVLTFILALPLWIMELGIGQFSRQGPVGVWKCVPAATGTGYAQVTVALAVATYYNVLLAYSLYYLAQSFRQVLPWSGCFEWWGADKELCFVRQKDISLCKNVPSLLYGRYSSINLTGETVALFNEAKDVAFRAPFGEYAALMSNCSKATTSAAEMYWERHVLELSSGISEVGGLKWDLVAYLFISWVIVYLCVVRGVSSSGKVVYFTATFPFVVITILLVKGLTLDGAMQGLEYYLVPKFEQLMSLVVWRRAAEQLFFSLGIGFGLLSMSGSFNDFRTTIIGDSLLVIVIDFIASFMGGIAIFSVLGYMSVTYGIPIEEVAKQGQGLAFVVYPEALTTFWCPQLWSVVFFVMLYLLGIDSEFPLVQSAITVVSDDFPSLRRHKALTAFVFCTGCFIVGLTCVTRGGQYVLNLLDTYAAGVSVLIAATIEVVAIMWIYGVRNFSKDVQFMLGPKPNLLLRFSWSVVSPVVLGVLVIFYFYDWTPIVYNNKEAYPEWADYLGLVLGALSIIQIPIVALLMICRKKSISTAFAPDEHWGPAEGDLFEEYKDFKRNEGMLELSRPSLNGSH